MSMNKKGQSALEFLMTYGWAILVVLAAIGALAYFGVLNPSNFLPDQCTSSTGFGCVGKPIVTADYAAFILTNGVGGAVTFSNDTLTLTSSASSCTTGDVFFCDRATGASLTGATAIGSPADCTSSRVVEDGQEFLMVIMCGNTGTVHKSVLKFTYSNAISGLPDEMTIQIAGKRK
jgi:hypothetical protein